MWKAVLLPVKTLVVHNTHSARKTVGVDPEGQFVIPTNAEKKSPKRKK